MISTLPDSAHLLTLLQLASPTLPVGAYSYSEGIETLTTENVVNDSGDLLHWLTQELAWGAIRIETAVMRWVYEAAAQQNADTIAYWNQWLSALRETEEVRAQSWQMGRSLLRLFADLEPEQASRFPEAVWQGNYNYAIAYGLVAQAWAIPLEATGLAYLQGWAANLISAGVRLVPLGQTEGQRLLKQLIHPLQQTHADVKALAEADLMACSLGVSLASMRHETQYSRLFRS